MARLIVTIDGPAASGKSTVARLLARKLGATFLDTGAMYRAVTFAAMQAGVDLSNEDDLIKLLDENDFNFKLTKSKTSVCVNGTDITDKIRTPSVTANAKYIASVPNVRKRLVRLQRQIAAEHDKIVTEGRDQGTVAFPDAAIKFYLDASSKERAKRRQLDLGSLNSKAAIKQVTKAIEARDKRDQTRKVGALKCAGDAIVVDTTKVDAKTVVEHLLSCIAKNA